MSSTFSSLKLWDVATNKYFYIEPSEGMTDDIFFVMPQTVPNDNQVYILAGVGSDGKFGLQVVNPFDIPELQGAQGEQGIQGEQGVPGIPGINGANGLGLTYVGSQVPSNPQDKETWLAETINSWELPQKFWIFLNNRWVEVNGLRHGFFAVNRTSAQQVDTFCQDVDSAEGCLSELNIRYNVISTLSPTNYWRMDLSALNVSGATVTPTNLLSVNLLDSAALNSRVLLRVLTEPLFFNSNIGTLRISFTRIGNPGGLTYNCSFKSHSVRL